MDKSIKTARKFIAASAIAVALFTTPLILNVIFDSSSASAGVISAAQAANADAGGHKGAMGEKTGGAGKTGVAGQGGKKGMSKVLEADDTSDRPPWAGGDKELNPHRGDPNPVTGIKKGDQYGDLYVVLRNPVTGEPLLVDGEYQICLDAACTETVPTVDGEVPAGVTAIEVEFGRASVARAPTKVTQHALDEVLGKLATAVSVTTDEAGRLVIDGATVDSPLENLALYIALMTDDPKLTDAVMAKLPGDVYDLAASALAGGADKTGTITIDFVVYQNVIMGVTELDEYYDYSTFDYDRSSYDVSYDYYYQSGDQVLSATVNLMDFLTATQPALTDAAGVTLFTISADDAVEIIELIHTQIHETLLPGTVTP